MPNTQAAVTPVGGHRRDLDLEREGHEGFPMHATTSVRAKKRAGRAAER